MRNRPAANSESSAAERLGFEKIGFMNIIRHGSSAPSAGGAHSDR